MTTMQSTTVNGVDTAALFTTLDAVKGNPEIAKFQFRATNRWVSGTHNRSTIHGFYGAGQELTHREASTFDADHPEVLTGNDNAPAPVEFLLHALAACLTSGSPTSPPPEGCTCPRWSPPSKATSTCSASSGCPTRSATATSRIRVSFKLEGDEPEKLRRVVEQSRRRSAVYDVLTNGVPVSIDVTA